MDFKNYNEIKKFSTNLKTKFYLGKEGISETFKQGILNYLKLHEIVKIKDLNCINKNDVSGKANNLAKDLNAQIIDIRGSTFVLYKTNGDR